MSVGAGSIKRAAKTAENGKTVETQAEEARAAEKKAAKSKSAEVKAEEAKTAEKKAVKSKSAETKMEETKTKTAAVKKQTVKSPEKPDNTQKFYGMGDELPVHLM